MHGVINIIHNELIIASLALIIPIPVITTNIAKPTVDVVDTAVNIDIFFPL